MKLHEAETVQWVDGEHHCVGKVMRDQGKAMIRYEPWVPTSTHVLVAHSHTRELEFVRISRLSPYPSEQIPEPQ